MGPMADLKRLARDLVGGIAGSLVLAILRVCDSFKLMISINCF